MRYDYDMRPEWIKAANSLADRMTTANRLMFDQFTYGHLNDHEAKLLSNAVSKAIEFVQKIDDEPGKAMIIIAHDTTGDLTRSGYGCGKTRLAETIADNNIFVQSYPDDNQTYTMRRGSFFEAREVMALFERERFKADENFAEFGNMVVIDDVGREGTLQYEKRDEVTQKTETQARYYNIINYCYQKKISLVLTSNLTAGQLAETIGGAAWSRLLEMTPSHYKINLSGIPDMRPMLAEF